MPENQYTLVISAVLCLVLSFSLTFYALQGLYMRVRSTDWRRTTGTIVTQTDNYLFLNIPLSCDVQYNYKLHNALYYGSRANSWGTSASPSTCLKLATETGVGVLTVYFNPRNFREGLLDESFDPLYFCNISGFSILFAATGLPFLFHAGFIIEGTHMNLFYMYASVMAAVTILVGASNFTENFIASIVTITIGCWYFLLIFRDLCKDTNQNTVY